MQRLVPRERREPPSRSLGAEWSPRGAGAAAWTSPEPVEIGPTVARWLGMTIALNGMSRSIGQGDLYPFVLSATVVAKLDFVLRAITQFVNDDGHP